MPASSTAYLQNLKANILINTHDRLHVVITDFGLANFVDANPATSSLSRTGASPYMAPEVLRSAREQGVPVRHSRESDMYSFGMLILLVRVMRMNLTHDIDILT